MAKLSTLPGRAGFCTLVRLLPASIQRRLPPRRRHDVPATTQPPVTARRPRHGRTEGRRRRCRPVVARVRETTGKLELFITASFPILHEIASAAHPLRPTPPIHRSLTRFAATVVHRCPDRRRPSEISRDWRGEIAGDQLASRITIMPFRAIIFGSRIGRGATVSWNADGGKVIGAEIAFLLFQPLREVCWYFTVSFDN